MSALDDPATLAALAAIFRTAHERRLAAEAERSEQDHQEGDAA